MKSVLSLMGRLNVARCCTVPGADMHITVPVIVRRLLGRSIGRSAKKGRRKSPNLRGSGIIMKCRGEFELLNYDEGISQMRLVGEVGGEGIPQIRLVGEVGWGGY
mmetsp:Transcript_31484/g.53311  ORF Transcript_31484/g.53311 Transcript_31484/m.53311 type:complete len:105 (-) Transcript_31484:21-335(-)